MINIYKKFLSYLTEDLDYPIYAVTDCIKKDNIFYPLDLSCTFGKPYPFESTCLDDSHILQIDYSRVPEPNNELGKQYNYTYIAYWALANLQQYLKNKDEHFKQVFLKQAEWLRFNCLEIGKSFIVWPVKFDWNLYGQWLRSPWVSCMDQGLVMSVLVRAYQLTTDKTYLDLAVKAVNFYDVSVEDNGFMAQFKPGHTYYEMFPVWPFSKIMDGFAFALMGLYDVYLTSGDNKSKELFDKGTETLAQNLSFWNFNGYWSRFGRFYLSPPWYHKINYCWLNIFYAITKDERFKIYENWVPGNLSFIKRIKVKTLFIVFSRSFSVKLYLKQKYDTYLLFKEKSFNIFKKVLHSLYKKTNIIIFEKDLFKDMDIINLPDFFKFKNVTLNNIRDMESIDSLLQLKEFEEMLSNKERGYCIYNKDTNEAIHRSWVIFGPCKAPIFYNLVHLKLAENEALIHYCKTKKDFRNKGMFREMMRYIFVDLYDNSKIRKIYIAIEEKNAPSIKAAERAGFIKSSKIRFKSFLGIKHFNNE